jgi:hypothetical protein
MQGEITLDYHAVKLFDEYNESLHLILSEDDTDVFRNFKSRQYVHVLKAAMILAAADLPNGPIVITRNILVSAINMVDAIAENIDDIFRGVGESDLSAAIARLQLYIERKGQVPYSQLVADNMKHINDADIVRTLKILETIGFVRVSSNGMSFLYEHTGQPINPNKRINRKVIP